MFLTIITFIIVLSLLVFAHEFGHFWVAKKCGLIPEEFGFGMPPRLWGIYKAKDGKWKKVFGNKKVDDAADTIYSLNWLFLGGFVKLGEDDDPGDNPNHFNNKPIWQRAVILLAGVSMNIVLAAFLFSFGYMIGLPQSTDGVSASAKISDRKIQVVEVVPNSPAFAAGLETGDIVLSVNSEEFLTPEELQVYANEHEGEELNYILKRSGKTFEKTIVPVLMDETNRGGIGIAVAQTGTVKYPIHIAIWEGIKTTLILTWLIIVAFYELIKGLILGQGVSIDLGGPVRIAEVTGDAMRMGFAYLINFTALLSINLAIINAFPFPALDGGRVIFLIVEKIKGKPVSKEIEGTIHYIGFALLMILIALVTYRDVARFWQ